MKNFLNKIIDILNKMTANKDFSDINFSKNEFYLLLDLTNAFRFLVCSTRNLVSCSVELANNVIRSNRILKDTYYLKSEDCIKLIDNDEQLQQLVNNNKKYEKLESLKTSFIEINKIFEKDENFLYEYLTFNHNKFQELKVIITNPLPTKFYAPVEIAHDELEKKYGNFIVSKSDNEILMSIFAFQDSLDLSDIKNAMFRHCSFVQRRQIINKMLSGIAVSYVKVNGNWLLKDAYNEDWQKTVEQMRKYQSSFLIINKNGEVLDNNKLDCKELLKKTRDNITHDNIFNYKVINKKIGEFSGKAIILDSNKALLFPDEIFSTLAHINTYNYKEEKHNCSYTYCPKIKSQLTTIEQWQDYLKTCMVIEIENACNFEKHKLDCVMEACLKKYFKLDNLQIKLEDYIIKYVLSVFKDLKFNIKNFENTEFVARKIVTNPFMVNETSETQLDVLNFYFNMFYDCSIVSKNILSTSGKNQSFVLKSTAYSSLIGNIISDINEGCSKDNINKYGKYRDEIYLLLCGFLIYANLIYNSFDDDISKRKTKLSEENRVKLEHLLTDELFADFNKINKNKSGRQQGKVETMQDKLDLISNIRNCVAHYEFIAKFAKNGNPQDHTLIFKYSREQNRPNSYFNISLGNFIKFIMNPVFSEYKQCNENYIETATFDELTKIISNKIKQNG